jgi:hypothetical protein
MFEQALAVTGQLSAEQSSALIARLDRTRTIGQNLGYGVGDDMDSLLAPYRNSRCIERQIDVT